MKASFLQIIRHFSLTILLTSGFNVACASTIAPLGTHTDSPRPATTSLEPMRCQACKDVIWIPTPEGLIG